MTSDIHSPSVPCQCCIFHSRHPSSLSLTSVEDEAIDSDLLIACHTDLIYQVFLIAQCAECGHEPAVSVVALSNIVCARAFDEEFRFLEDVLKRPLAVTWECRSM